MPAQKKSIYSMTQSALFIALLCASSYIVIPLPFTPVMITLHSAVINLIGLLLPVRWSAITITVYLLMGLIGLPVFSGGVAGPAKLFSPTGGFYLGFFLVAIILSLCKGKKKSFRSYLLLTVFVGIPIQHLCAMAVMYLNNGHQLWGAFVTTSLPFLPGDILKCILASMVAVSLQKRMHK